MQCTARTPDQFTRECSQQAVILCAIPAQARGAVPSVWAMNAISGALYHIQTSASFDVRDHQTQRYATHNTTYY